jgi:hypothetical protein
MIGMGAKSITVVRAVTADLELFTSLVLPTDLLEYLEIRVYFRQMSNFAAFINPD